VRCVDHDFEFFFGEGGYVGSGEGGDGGHS
jgi:hypothetical protein